MSISTAQCRRTTIQRSETFLIEPYYGLPARSAQYSRVDRSTRVRSTHPAAAGRRGTRRGRTPSTPGTTASEYTVGCRTALSGSNRDPRRSRHLYSVAQWRPDIRDRADEHDGVARWSPSRNSTSNFVSRYLVLTGQRRSCSGRGIAVLVPGFSRRGRRIAT